MAEREEVFDVTIPANTAVASPVTIDVSFAPGTVVAMEVVIPDGCAGLVGFALAVAHQQVIPRQPGRYFTGNDEVLKREISGYLNTGSWQVVGYNTDINQHTLEVRFSINEVKASTEAGGEPEALTSITTGAGLSDGSSDVSGDLFPTPTTGDGSIGDGSGTDLPLPGDDTTPPADVPTDGTTDPTAPDTSPDDTDVPADDSTDTGDPTIGDDGGDAALEGDAVSEPDFADDGTGTGTPTAAKDRHTKAKAKAKHPAKAKPKAKVKRAPAKTVVTHGADKAVAWAVSRIGHYAENTGKNTGTELDELERLVGDHGEPWCAIFATTAVVHGGLPKTSRTAGVATLVDWANAGSNGYQRGVLHVSQARHGDLVVRGTEHTGFVEKNIGGTLTVIEGNTTAGVVERNVYPGGGPWTGAVRPRYTTTTKKVPAKRAPTHSKAGTKAKPKATPKKRAPAKHAPVKKAPAKRAPAKPAAKPAHKPAPRNPPPKPRKPAPKPLSHAQLHAQQATHEKAAVAKVEAAKAAVAKAKAAPPAKRAPAAGGAHHGAKKKPAGGKPKKKRK